MESERDCSRLLRTVLIMSTCLLMALTAMGQGQAPQQGPPAANAPVKSGYAVITPTSANTAGLVVLETFGEQHGNDMMQAGVLPTGMSTRTLLFVSTDGRLSKNIGVAIANPSDLAANVTLTLRDDQGKILATTQVPVEARHQAAKFVTELFPAQTSVPQALTGTLDIESKEVPVAVIGLRFRGVNFSTLPATNLSGSIPDVPSLGAGVGGASAVILPQFATGGGWATEIVLSNTGTGDLTVRVDLFGQDGDALVTNLNGKSASSFTDITIKPGGVVVLESGSGDSGS